MELTAALIKPHVMDEKRKNQHCIISAVMKIGIKSSHTVSKLDDPFEISITP